MPRLSSRHSGNASRTAAGATQGGHPRVEELLGPSQGQPEYEKPKCAGNETHVDNKEVICQREVRETMLHKIHEILEYLCCILDVVFSSCLNVKSLVLTW